MNVTEDQAAVTDELWELMKQAVPDGIGPFVDAIVGDEINLHFPHAGLSPGCLAEKVLKSHVESCPLAGRPIRG
jgi:hypothetical protein